MAEIQIVPAQPADAEAIWQIFHAVVKKGDTYVYAPESTRDFFEDLWLKQPVATFVAKENGVVVGTYVLRKNRPGLGDHVSNAGYMTHPEHQGKGIGQALCAHSLTEAKKRGFTAMQFNFVVSTNTRAVKLWQKMGFSIIGTVPNAYRHQPLGKLVDVHIMHRGL